MQAADAGVAQPREDELAGHAGADHLVVDDVRRQARQGQVALALADDLVAGREADEVREALDGDGVAVAHELGDGVVHRFRAAGGGGGRAAGRGFSRGLRGGALLKNVGERGRGGCFLGGRGGGVIVVFWGGGGGGKGVCGGGVWGGGGMGGGGSGIDASVAVASTWRRIGARPRMGSPVHAWRAGPGEGGRQGPGRRSLAGVVHARRAFRGVRGDKVRVRSSLSTAFCATRTPRVHGMDQRRADPAEGKPRTRPRTERPELPSVRQVPGRSSGPPPQ